MGMNSHPLFISNITVNESQDGKVHAILGRHNRKIEVSFRVGQNYMNIEEKTFKKSKMTPVRIDINDNLNTHELVQLINGLISIHNGRLNPVIIGSGEPSPSFYLSTRTDLKSARNGTHTTRLGSNSRVHKRATRSQEGTTKSSRTCCNNAKQDRLNSIQSLATRLQDNVGLHRPCHVGIIGDLSPSLFSSLCKRAMQGVI